MQVNRHSKFWFEPEKKLLRVGYDIYVSSSSDYFVTVNIPTKRLGQRDFWLNDGFLLSKANATDPIMQTPKRVADLIFNLLRERYQVGELRFHEYNREGVKRYEGLRYHCPPQFEYLLGLRSEVLE